MPVLQEAFTVAASQERVWAFLMEVERLALCLPGCEDVRRLSDDTFRARVKVKLGPFSTSQGMTVRLTETDPPRHLVSEGESDDSLLGGKARMKMTLDLLALGPEEHRSHTRSIWRSRVGWAPWAGRFCMTGPKPCPPSSAPTSKRQSRRPPVMDSGLSEAAESVVSPVIRNAGILDDDS